MEYDFLGRITRPYNELIDLFNVWSKQCRNLWVYEHEADEKVNRTHCHFFISGSRADREKLKERVSWKCLKLKGNEDSAMKTYDKSKEYSYITYMTKGVLEYKLAFGHNADVIAQECKDKWVDVKKVVSKKDKKVRDRTYWDIVEEIKGELPYVEVLKSDIDGNVVYGKRIADYDITYNVLMEKLNKYKIRTADFEINRWLTTIFRDDPYWGSSIKENLRKKYLPV